MEDTDDDELPEALSLHKALAIAVLALELIASQKHQPVKTARSTLRLLRRQHPDAVEHMKPENT